MSKVELRKLMRSILKGLSTEAKAFQSKQVSHYLLTKSIRFRNAKHIALYLPMKSEELDITSVIEALLTKGIYTVVPRTCLTRLK